MGRIKRGKKCNESEESTGVSGINQRGRNQRHVDNQRRETNKEN